MIFPCLQCQTLLFFFLSLCVCLTVPLSYLISTVALNPLWNRVTMHNIKSVHGMIYFTITNVTHKQNQPEAVIPLSVFLRPAIKHFPTARQRHTHSHKHTPTYLSPCLQTCKKWVSRMFDIPHTSTHTPHTLSQTHTHPYTAAD